MKDLSIKLDNFEGPMELLLHLVEVKEMSIYEIQISKVIDEYLLILSEMKENNIHIKVDFLVMASELLEIKALSILNFKKKLEKEKNLEQKLIDYKVIKYLAKDIEKLENECNLPFKRKGLDIKLDDYREIDLSKLSLKLVFETYYNVLKETEEKEIMEINIEESYSLTEEMNFIIEKIKIVKELSYDKIFEEAKSRLHLVYIFLAVLELYREKIIEVSDINIYYEDERGNFNV
ncbi:MAG: segregation/condensation protein A [Fusobacteriaceae bacterium]|nr:segregation/condensation protein A [Fusobacteriaceae bacterium]MBN2838498.1 segregation/condensation protein A [Fusobacteriaceae bacterium]